MKNLILKLATFLLLTICFTINVNGQFAINSHSHNVKFYNHATNEYDDFEEEVIHETSIILSTDKKKLILMNDKTTTIFSMKFRSNEELVDGYKFVYDVQNEKDGLKYTIIGYMYSKKCELYIADHRDGFPLIRFNFLTDNFIKLKSRDITSNPTDRL